MTQNIWGATRAEWEAFARLAPADIRPTVLNPDLMTLPTKTKPVSVRNAGEFSKFPSRVLEGGVAGMPGWQAMDAVQAEIEGWSINPDLGCGFVGRTIKAIDVDIDDPELAEEVDAAIAEFFGTFLPQRRRHNSSRRMLLFRLTEPDKGRKKVVVHPAEGGAIELLFDRSFFVLAGTHKSGNRQYWPDGIPESLEDIPAITPERLLDFIAFLREEFGDEGPAASSSHVEVLERDHDQVDRSHPTYKAVVESEFFRDHLPNGAIAVKCPWWHLHSDGIEAPEDLTTTVVFPVGLGERDTMGYKCQHVSHGEKTGKEFLEAIGYGADEFPVVADITEAQDTRPGFVRMTKDGGIPPNEINLSMALHWPAGIGFEIAFDGFRGDVMIRVMPEAVWRPFSDTDYFDISMSLLRQGFLSVPEVKLRSAVGAVAKARQFDSAIDWLKSLRWDGKDRLARFHRDILHAEDTEYAQSVVHYLFTALAGRVLSPGIKADMVPVFVGKQGVRKSTFIHALAPDGDLAVDIDLSSRDADTARLVRGKVIVEMAELRGLGTRDEDSIKAWITRTHEEWVPKYKEFSSKLPRRFVMAGTSNNRRFLADATGERRWLPMCVCVDGEEFIEVDYVIRHRDQLWAQAAAMFMADGIKWERAEHLAKFEHHKFARRNLTTAAIERWLHEVGKAEVSTVEIAERALRIDLTRSGIAKDVYHIERAMQSLGYTENEKGNWHLPFL